MAKISEYGNYETGKSPTEIENFKDTGVIPVSGSYTGSNNDMTTKSIALSDLAGSGLPDTTGHNQGDVLAIGANGPDWSEPTSDLPDTTGHNQGDVLTIGANGPDWSVPASGGGGLSRATATLSAVESSDWSQSVSISNNTYTKVTNKIDSTTEIVKIYVEQCDMPHAYVELETDGDDVESIPVYIGNSETNLQWMHPSYTFNGSQKVVVDGDENKDWVMQIPSDSTIIVEIIGNFINIHCNRATLGHDAGGGGD